MARHPLSDPIPAGATVTGLELGLKQRVPPSQETVGTGQGRLASRTRPAGFVLPPAVAEMLVNLVQGEITVTVPLLFSLMLVGPVYMHPGCGTCAGRSLRVSSGIVWLVGGMSMDWVLTGLPASQVASPHPPAMA